MAHVTIEPEDWYPVLTLYETTPEDRDGYEVPDSLLDDYIATTNAWAAMQRRIREVSDADLA